MFLQQRHKLGFKIHLFMMLFLILYIPDHDRNNRSTYAERPVTLLPYKLVALFASPSR